MTASSPPARATKSTCTTEKVEGLHRFDIRNYSLTKHLATGDSVRSGVFPVGGYDWCVHFYPSGCPLVGKGDTSVYIQLMTMTNHATTRATFVVRVVNPASGRSMLKGHAGIGKYINDETKHGIRLMKTAELERTYLDRDRDRFIIECTLSVIGEPRASATTPLGGVPVVRPPPSELPAHRLVHAMRSPVFKASLFGPMSEDGCNDVDPAVFKVLLDVIYSDSFPAMDGLDEDANRELAGHLLVAADRYGMGRLKAQCESILSTSLSAHTVASKLALADRHGCHQLKDACIDFIITLGMSSGSIASREDDQLLSCFTFLKYFCKAVGSILKIH